MGTTDTICKKHPFSYVQKSWWEYQLWIPSYIIGEGWRNNQFLTYNLWIHWWSLQYYSIESNATAKFNYKGSHAPTRYFPERRHVLWKSVATCSAFGGTRWRKEVLETLQTRQRWNPTKRNFKVGDNVLVRGDVIRNKWPMARILKTYSDEQGLVWSVQLVTGRTNSTDKET